MRRWIASSSFTLEASVIECRGWCGDPCDMLTLRGEMKALSGSVYNQAELGSDDLRVLTGVLLSAAALSDIEAIIIRWRCGGGNNGGASLLIDSVMLTDTLSSHRVTKSCCRGSSSSTLTSPGSGIIISLHDSSAPLILTDADTPAPYSTPPPLSDELTTIHRPPSRIGRCGAEILIPKLTDINTFFSIFHFVIMHTQVHTIASTSGFSYCCPRSSRWTVCRCWLQVTLDVFWSLIVVLRDILRVMSQMCGI
jgi:hypothetical protein